MCALWTNCLHFSEHCGPIVAATTTFACVYNKEHVANWDSVFAIRISRPNAKKVKLSRHKHKIIVKPKSESPNHNQGTHSTHPQLLTMKECSRDQVLIGKKSKDEPLNPFRWSVGTGGQWDQEHGVVLHVQGECYQPPITYREKCLSITPPTHTGHQLDQVDSEIKNMG